MINQINLHELAETYSKGDANAKNRARYTFNKLHDELYEKSEIQLMTRYYKLLKSDHFGFYYQEVPEQESLMLGHAGFKISTYIVPELPLKGLSVIKFSGDYGTDIVTDPETKEKRIDNPIRQEIQYRTPSGQILTQSLTYYTEDLGVEYKIHYGPLNSKSRWGRVWLDDKTLKPKSFSK